MREALDCDEQRMRRYRRRFYAQMVGHDDLCFDIGANVGNRVGVFRSLGARVTMPPACYVTVGPRFSTSIHR